MTLPANDKSELSTIVNSFNVPAALKHERENTMESLAELRKHFEGKLFPAQSPANKLGDK